MVNYYIYDIEVYPNIFTLAVKMLGKEDRWLFECSPRRNDLQPMVEFLFWLKTNDSIMVGFNNLAYDYPVLHYIINDYMNITPFDIYKKSMSIINSPYSNRFSHIIWDRDQYVKQLDLFKIL